MDAFFSRHGFTQDPDAGLLQEFSRLSIARKWRPATRRSKRDAFRTAMVEEFNRRYGIDDRSLASWQNLCSVFSIQPVPASISQCKKKIRRIHVNLVDMIELGSDGEPVQMFRNLDALRSYTKDTKKVFPKDEAKAGGILKYLLRVIM